MEKLVTVVCPHLSSRTCFEDLMDGHDASYQCPLAKAMLFVMLTCAQI